MKSYASRIGLKSDEVMHKIFGYSELNDSGYIRLNSKQAVAIIDTAPVGPDYIPGHAHADTLSFEFKKVY